MQADTRNQSCCGGAPPTKVRSQGRSLADFQIDGAATKHRLLPAEEELLKAARTGVPCDLKAQERAARAEAAIKRLHEASFFDLCVDYISQQLVPSDEFKAKLAQEPELVRPFFEMLARFAQSDPGAPHNRLEASDLGWWRRFLPACVFPVWPREQRTWKDILKDNHEALRLPFDECHATYRRELNSWRSISTTDENVLVRGGFVRFLALGGDDATPVHEKGVQLKGAFIASKQDNGISGAVDLENCTGVRPLALSSCYCAERPIFAKAELESLQMTGCRVPGIDAHDAKVRGRVRFDDGFRSEGQVNLQDCEVGGRLICTGATLVRDAADSSAPALFADRAEIAKTVQLDNGFRSEGAVRFGAAEIKGDFSCRAGTFLNRSPNGTSHALFCERIIVKGGVLLDSTSNVARLQRFRAEGAVVFKGAQIGHNLHLTGARLNNAAHDEAQVEEEICRHGRTSTNAIDLEDAAISGVLWLGPAAQNRVVPTKILGSLNLQAAKVDWLCDHRDYWPKARILLSDGKTELRSRIKLDGLTYGQFTGDSTAGATARKTWLRRQEPKHLGHEFRPQPWEQLIKVYRAMGHEHWARRIATAKQRRLRWAIASKNLRSWKRNMRERNSNKLLATLKLVFRMPVLVVEWFLVGVVAGYGYGTLRLLAMLIVLYFASAEIYRQAAEQGLFAPKAVFLIAHNKGAKPGEPTDPISPGCRQNWTACGPPAVPSEYPRFSPHLYAADLLFPLVSFGQEDSWVPRAAEAEIPAWQNPCETIRNDSDTRLCLSVLRTDYLTWWWFLRAVTWIEVVGGWLLSFLLVGVLSGVMKSD